MRYIPVCDSGWCIAVVFKLQFASTHFGFVLVTRCRCARNAVQVISLHRDVSGADAAKSVDSVGGGTAEPQSELKRATAELDMLGKIVREVGASPVCTTDVWAGIFRSTLP